ncbi:recombinase family protein [Micrococcus luteus]|uniref:recombinase family protein n=1 Tax=Micrococcus luteus TaxID=1270 RepID=UPI0038796973
MTSKRAAIYTRISRDDRGDEAGVTRQEEDCRAKAAGLGFEVVQVYTDNDIGASTRSRKVRPGYAQMLEAARRGAFGAILAYSTSRLTRRPREAEDLIDLVERHGVQIKTVVSGDWNLETADGRAVVRTLAAWDAAEAERTAERVARACEQRAAEGRTHGAVPYGWTRDADGTEHLHPEQAQVIRDAAAHVLEGGSLRSFTLDLNARGVGSPRGGKWTAPQLKQLLLRERNAGRLVRRDPKKPGHRPVIGQGAWPPILDEETHDRVVARLTDPTRRKSRGSDLKYMMSGILICGACGAKCRLMPGGRAKDGTPRPPSYGCRECFGAKRRVAQVDEFVSDVMRLRLEGPDAPVLLAGDNTEVVEAQQKREELRARLDRAADDYAEGHIDARQLARISARLRDRLETAEATLASARPAGGLPLDLGVPAAQAWDAAPVAARREVIDALMEVTLVPGGRGSRFDPALHLRIVWRS